MRLFEYLRHHRYTIYSQGKFNIFGILRFLSSKGADTVLVPTLKCNFACSYCSAEQEGSSCWISPADERDVSFWIKHFENVIEPKYGKVKQVRISGGEPFLYKDILPLIEYFINRKIFVYIFSNLSLTTGLKLKKSNRIKIMVSYHEEEMKRLGLQNKVDENIKKYSKKFYVVVQKLVEESTNRFEKKIYSEHNYLALDRWSPDGKLYAKDENPDKEKYDMLRNKAKGRVANPNREKLLKVNK